MISKISYTRNFEFSGEIPTKINSDQPISQFPMNFPMTIDLFDHFFTVYGTKQVLIAVISKWTLFWTKRRKERVFENCDNKVRLLTIRYIKNMR